MTQDGPTNMAVTETNSIKMDDPEEPHPGAFKMTVASRQLKRQLSGQRNKFDSIGRKYNWSARSSWVSEADLPPEISKKGIPDDEVAPTMKRWIILILFCLNSSNKSFQWISIVALTTKATEYYQVENYVINITSIVFLVSFIILSWPACLLIESMGLRRAVLLASFGTALGSVVKCFSCEDGEATSLGITLLMIGQILVSLAEQLIFSVPSRMASVWFPDNEVSSSVALSFFGNQLGVAIGFLLPNYLMRDAETREQIGLVFHRLFFWVTVYSIATFVACWWLLDEEPVKAPGKARWRQREMERAADRSNDDSLWVLTCTLFKHMGGLLKNTDLMLLSLSFGFVIGANNTILTLLDQMFASTWPDNEVVVGNSGFLFVVFGACGMIVWGWIMDKTHAYKWINMWLVIGSLVSTIMFAYALTYAESIPGVYISATLMGIFTTAPMATCLEYAVELTYPAPELVTSSVMNVMPQLAATPAILVGSYIVDNYGALHCNVFYMALFVAGLILLAVTRERLLRQEEIGNQARQEKIASA